jgi:hypothetical protein
MALERHDVEASLEKKGFVARQGDHSYFTYHTRAGQKTSVWTKTSHGTGHRTLSDNLVSKMAQQCSLTTGQFKQLVACPLTREELERILVDVGRIKAQ